MTPADEAKAQAALDEMIRAGLPVGSFEFKGNGVYFHFTRKPTQAEFDAAEVIAWKNIHDAAPHSF